MLAEILSNYAVAEYRLVVALPPVLQERIVELKKKFADAYDCPEAVSGRPVITLIRFQQYEMMELKILRRMELLAMAQHEFLVEMSDFGSLPSHSIYIPITTQGALTERIRAFRSLLPLLKPDKERKPHYVSEPYLPFAHKLLPWQYEKGWLEMSHTHFSGRFIADHFWLQRRRKGETRFEKFKKLPLMHVRETCQQGSLFD